MRILKYIALVMVVVLCGGLGVAHGQDTRLVYAAILDGDTVPYCRLQEVSVVGMIAYLTPDEIRKNQRLIRNVKKMLPYAKMGKQRLDQIEAAALQMGDKERREYIRKMEKSLLDEFEDELKQFTISQGKVLLKMVDRETGRTSYQLVNELRGKMRAGFYQLFARLFGYNLKKGYDPQHNKDDNLMERVILSVEAGKV